MSSPSVKQKEYSTDDIDEALSEAELGDISQAEAVRKYVIL